MDSPRVAPARVTPCPAIFQSSGLLSHIVKPHSARKVPMTLELVFISLICLYILLAHYFTKLKKRIEKLESQIASLQRTQQNKAYCACVELKYSTDGICRLCHLPLPPHR